MPCLFVINVKNTKEFLWKTQSSKIININTFLRSSFFLLWLKPLQRIGFFYFFCCMHSNSFYFEVCSGNTTWIFNSTDTKQYCSVVQKYCSSDTLFRINCLGNLGTLLPASSLTLLQFSFLGDFVLRGRVIDHSKNSSIKKHSAVLHNVDLTILGAATFNVLSLMLSMVVLSNFDIVH